ncbi:sensor histidine kinase [Erythrobacter dokdonensis]|uniref:sensor histidine kinase n=1 Tax=Erythrobacter dokdonensis TaxID=328225 RepID=UPI000A043806|nr:HAMP domain-containing sensor histidine kinase [Erythrobacter dokdonensis]
MMRVPVAGSLRLRFLLAVTLWVILGIAAIWFSAVSIFSRHVEQSYHEELEVHVRELGRLTEIAPDGMIVLTRPLSDPRYDVPLSGFYWQVTADGRAPLRSPSMTRGSLEEDIAHSPEILHRLENGPTGPAITYGFTRKGAAGEDIHFVIATDQRELDRLIGSFTRDLTAWLAALAALLLATGFTIISFGLRPLDRLSLAFARLRHGETDKLEGDYPAEIAPLAADLNAYIHQNEAMVARARVQAGNLAHSLRTPLAIITDEAERLAKHGESRAAGMVLLDQASAMEQQIEYQLAQARASAGKPPSGRGVVLPDIAMPILRAMERLHPDKGFTLDANGCKGVVLPLDPVDFAEVLSILLDNAGKWSRSRVALSFTCDKTGACTIRIADDGPGIPADRIDQAFVVGTRFDREAAGSGLGLAIAQELCAAMGITLTLRNGTQGLVAELRHTAARPVET